MTSEIERKPDTVRTIVTIDGPAGAGKSSVSRLAARTLGLWFLDTGAMYRAATLLALRSGIPLDEGPAVAKALRESELSYSAEEHDAPPRITLHGKAIDPLRLRQPDVDSAVSPVSALPEVREVLVEAQRRIGREHPRLLSEGRDQGSVVFPQAEVKIFLFASPRVRAERRAAQLLTSGVPANVDQIEEELRQRDERDMNRAVGPLTKPDDAVELDTSLLTRSAVVDEIVRIVREAVRDHAETGAG
ncbi:MAG: (d)CMP kinase [Planctomycetota bacterium]